ncbi:MAG: hypothetical protein OXL38_07625 [Gammaproteobacteria bacterium]|nr:hypothetical protein [Gammaproteobacteria bacterium]
MPSDGEIDAYLAANAPPVVDPFCGGGSIPLEAQRLGLRALGSDLNPVAVLVTKALVEFPSRFMGRPPVNPDLRDSIASTWTNHGSGGLAEDVRYYGKWMRDEAVKRIGHLYPKVEVTHEMAREREDLKPYEGRKLTVVAWLWARTVASPNPAANGAHVPLVTSFVVSSKKGKEAIIVPVVERTGYRFVVKSSGITSAELSEARMGTKGGRGATFRCLVSGAPVASGHIKAEGRAGRMDSRLMAVVAEGKRGRLYLSPTADMECAAHAARPLWRPEQKLPTNPRWFSPPDYGMRHFGDLFTERQLVALTTFSDLVGEAWNLVRDDCLRAQCERPEDEVPLAEGGSGAHAYADAVATYLAFSLDKMADRGSSLCTWFTERNSTRNTLSRQALPMTWDFAELNPLLTGTGSFLGACLWTAESVEGSPSSMGQGARVTQRDAATDGSHVLGSVIATDPPYYDNIGYADLSDYFYVWLRRTLNSIHADLFRTLLTPKTGELVATPYRFGGNREEARRFFEAGLGRATANMRTAQSPDYPLTLFYAYKQAEKTSGGDWTATASSTGWETMLSGLVASGFAITGTWPVRSELGNRMIAGGTNALASSIVLACRPRPDDARMVTRRDFTSALRRELPPAIRQLQNEFTAPVDLRQAAIGPGMAVFSRYAQVLEADGAEMAVRQALVEIHRVLDETLAHAEGEMDADTRFCVAWFEQFGIDERPYGEAEVLFTATNTSFDGLARAGVLVGGRGKVRLKRRDELETNWDPATDHRIADWECVQHLVRAMTAESGGGTIEAARLAAAMGVARAERARGLAYRLHAVSERNGWSGEALAYNVLATSWPQIQSTMAELRQGEQTQLPV